ncbi:MAG TPA: lipid IV(A) 3-deoxy-D-manno-octulosonic acid transferase [Gammaproteobacteria bacterium]|nr:lipid IV(A) 3-deoxy-D-manno-octulosonic acid transferase [Gammaproteobacteria bacterium]
MRAVYSLAFRCLLPLALAYLLLLGRRDRRYWRGWSERFGRVVPVAAGRRTIWVHAVSVGEVMAATPLIRRIMAERPETGIVVTTFTPTGRERAMAAFGDSVRHCYVPLDLPGAVHRFLDRVRPELAIVMETELWPNLFDQCRRRGVPVVLANARISRRSLHAYRRLRRLAAWTLARVSLAAAQSETDAHRLDALGLPRERLRITGNLKFDFPFDPAERRRGLHWRASWGPRRPVWIAASTHEGEDEQVLRAHRALRQRIPQALLVLVPRHPHRFAAAYTLCTGQGFAVARRSAGETPGPRTDVFLGDTMGELMLYYAAADLAFVGGSLVRVGGHNLLEPASLGLPVLTGSDVFNFADISAALEEAGALRVVRDAGELADAVASLMDQPERAHAMGEQGLDLVRRNGGVLDSLLQELAPYLDRSVA